MELLNHNKITLVKALERFNVDNTLLIVQATSTGKTYITMALIKELFAESRILYVVPKKIIAESIQAYEDWNFDNVDFITYQKLSKLETPYILSKYNLIIYDEAHHTKAKQWGKHIKELKSYNIKILGLTATPGEDVVDKVFDNNVIYGPDIYKAIQEGILQDYLYFITTYDMETNYSELSVESREAGYTFTDISNYYLKSIIAHVLKGRNKWIIFCSSLYQMQRLDDDIREWFGEDIIILEVDGYTSKGRRLEIFNEFSNTDKLVILKTVSVLNEGVHVSGVTGLIMLKRTKSINLYLQQLGRGMHTSKGIMTAVIDVVESYKVLSKIVGSTISKSNTNNINKSKAYLSQIDIKTMRLLTELEKLEDLRNKRIIKENDYWSDESLRILKKNYKHYGMRIKQMLPLIPEKEIKKKVKDENLKYIGMWTPMQDLAIINNQPVEGRTQIECDLRYKELCGKNRGE